MKRLLFVMLLASIFAFDATSQCGRVSLIGEFNAWAGDHFMVRQAESPADFHVIITVTEADDEDLNGTVELKFRENADWTVNWGGPDFPAGTAELDGDNLSVPYGTWIVRFNCETLAYSFESTCGMISMIGEFNGWADDLMLTRVHGQSELWYGTVYFTEAHDTDSNGFVDAKFRENMDWANNWGSSDFPSGTGELDGDNIPIPLGGYLVAFNCETGFYLFQPTCGEISLIGEMNAWAGDLALMRDFTQPNMWHGIITLDATSDTDADSIINMKFRQNADWGTNWGSSDFPTGTGVLDGDNIPVPLVAGSITTDYFVTFDCGTGDYSFMKTSGAISMIGAFNGWNGDVPMNRSMTDPNMWMLTKRWHSDSEVKFRENMDWSYNWGDAAWPSGTGTPNGDNIPLVAGTYDVTFDFTTKNYNFVANNDVCGEIGMVGDFNNWGVPETAGDPETDVYLVRDPMFPSQFSLEYNFTGSTSLLFRMDAMPILNDNVWGGSFPCDNGEHDVTQVIPVAGGKYKITFNCKSGDYCFERLGNAVIAPKVFAITVDGFVDEADWDISQPVSNLVEGELNDDVNEAYFGVTYTETHLYIGMDITDAILAKNDQGELFIDGDKSGGPYDDHDCHVKFGVAGVEVITGPMA